MTEDELRKDIKKLIALGKKNGFLTYEEINNALSNSIESFEEIDNVFNILDGENIKIIESEKEEEAKGSFRERGQGEIVALNIRELFADIIGSNFDAVLKRYSWSHKTPLGINGFTTIGIRDFEAFATIGFQSDTENDIVTNCIVSIGQPKDIERYGEELTLRSEIIPHLDEYYGQNIPVLDSKYTLIAWDINEEKILLYNVSENGVASLQLYSKFDRKAQSLLDLINAK